MKLSLKQMVSTLLCLALAAGSFVLPVNATAPAAITAGIKSYIVSAQGDTATIVPQAAEGATPAVGQFGSKENAGRIWTDKSVAANGDGTFDITLSAVAQEYIAAFAGNIGPNPADRVQADVVFVLDFSGSMSNASGQDVEVGNGSTDKIFRLEAMRKATNEAIKTIMDANPKNRVGVYWFAGTTNTTGLEQVGELMPMDSYRVNLPSGLGEFLVRGDSKGKNLDTAISTHANLQVATKDGTYVTFAQKTKISGNGTPTQQGVMYGIQKAIAKISADDFATYGKRQPFVFLLSDGAAGVGKTKWWEIPKNPTMESSYSDLGTFTAPTAADGKIIGSADMAATLILTAAHQKQLLTEAYAAYNTAGGSLDKYETFFYSVGLGSSGAINVGQGQTAETSQNYAWCGLNPLGLKKETYYNSSVINDPASPAAKNTLTSITSFTTGKNKPASNITIAGKKTAAQYESDYQYSAYYFYAASYPDLNKAFEQLSKDVKEATTEKLPPTEGEVGEGTDTDSTKPSIIFVDELGANMSISSAPKLEKVTGTATTDGLGAEAITTYKFDGYDSTVVVKNNQVAFHVAPKDLGKHMYSFQDAVNPKEGEYTSALPLKLVYQVASTLDATSAKNYYSNSFSGTPAEAKTTAVFTPVMSNPYYYFTNKYVGLVGKPDEVGLKEGSASGVTMPVVDEEVSHYYTGTHISATEDLNAANAAFATNKSNVYVTYKMTVAKGAPDGIKKSKIGTLINITAAEYAAYTDEYKKALSLTMYDCITATAIDDSKAYAFRVGIPNSNFANEKSNIETKMDENPTGTAEYSSKSVLQEGKLTMQLGNNGKQSLLVGIQKKPATGAAGGNAAYEIVVTNYTDASKTVAVSDVKASFASSNATDISNAGSNSGGNVLWQNISVPANGSVTLSYKLPVPASTQVTTGIQYATDATLTYSGTSAKSNAGTTIVAGSYTAVFKDGQAELSRQSNLTLGGSITEPAAPTKTGYDFAGWCLTDPATDAAVVPVTFTAGKYAPSPVPTHESVVTLYAKWTAKNLTLTFDTQGGTPVNPPSISVTYQGHYNEAIVAFPVTTRDNYVFLGWFTEQDGGGSEIVVTDKVSITQNTTLYAYWRAQYTVTFDPNGGTEMPEGKGAITKNNGTAIVPADVGTTGKTGYTFEGWYTAAQGGTLVSFANGGYMPDTSTTVYAHWAPKKSQIIFTPDGELDTPANTEVTYDETYSIITPPIKPGYSFDGYVDANGKEYYDENGNPTESTWNCEDDTVTLKPRWNANVYQLTFDLNPEPAEQDETPSALPDGMLKTISITYDKPYSYGGVDIINMIGTPVRNGYNFVEWNLNPNGGGTVVSSDATVAVLPESAPDNTLTAYAIWTQKKPVQVNKTQQSYGYDGTPKAFEVIPLDESPTNLSEYTVNYYEPGTNNVVTNPTNAGKYDVVITRQEDETYANFNLRISNGLVVTPVTLTKGDFEEIFSSVEYNGTQQKPPVIPVLVDPATNTPLVEDKDYTVTYGENKEQGTGTVIINGKGNYDGAVDLTFEITPPKDKIITGTVKDDSESPKPVKDATVSVQKNGKEIANTKTDENGNFLIPLNPETMPEGVYNLVITAPNEKGENVTITTIIEIKNESIQAGTIVFPLGSKNTIFEAEDETPVSAVGGLDTQFVAAAHNTDENIGVLQSELDEVENKAAHLFLTLYSKHVNKSTQQNEIAAVDSRVQEDKRSVGMQLDLSVEKNLKDASNNVMSGYPKPVKQLNGIVAVHINMVENLWNKPIYGVYRYHAGGVQALPMGAATEESDGEYFVVSGDKKSITIYAKRFSVYAIASAEEYNITASAGQGGSINPAGEPLKVVQGDNMSFTITPQDGYRIKDVLVDGVSVGAVGSYTLSNIQKDHTVSAVFERIPSPVIPATPSSPSNAGDSFLITSSSNEGGTITPIGDIPYASGSNATYEIVPARGYSIKDVIVDGVSMGALKSFAFSGVSGQHSIRAVFVRTNSYPPRTGDAMYPVMLWLLLAVSAIVLVVYSRKSRAK